MNVRLTLPEQMGDQSLNTFILRW